MAKEIRDKSDVESNFYQSSEDVPHPRELSSEKKNLLVFHDVFYLSQNYSSSHAKQSERTRISYV